jgi:AraC family transcriptional regulator, transcriptional activator FtrA
MQHLIDKRRRVVVIAYDGLCTFEYGIAYEVFGLPRPEAGPDWYSFKTVPVEAGELRASGGLSFKANGTLNDLYNAGLVIVPGWRGIDQPVPGELCESLRRAHKAGARIVSICSGVFVLAAAGLLDNRRATTHWRFLRSLSERHPTIKVEPNLLYTDEGDVLTSAGSSAGIDVCLHIVRTDFGTKIANSVARRLVMHSHRSGGQAQFIEQPVPNEHESHRFSAVLDCIRANIAASFEIEELAAQVGMSTRTFHRRFLAITGMPPLKWINEERLRRAHDLLETSTASLEDIAAASGLSGTESLRYHFRRRFRVGPDEYRKRFAWRATS